MCDYSLQNVKSRAAKVGDKLTTRNFGTGTRGFAASEDASLAVCVLPGTELSFSNEVTCQSTGLFAGSTRSHLICAARHSISHRLYSPLQSRDHRFCGVCELACCRARGHHCCRGVGYQSLFKVCNVPRVKSLRSR
jgi:hypothetical protein